MDGGCGVIADIILLRVAAVLTHDPRRPEVYVVPDFPLDPVQLDERHPGPDLEFGGVVDYMLAKYPPIGMSNRLGKLCS